MKRATAWLILLSIIGLCIAATADGLTESLNEPVPFGIAHTSNGTGITVYKSTTGKNSVGTLADYQVCAILETKTVNGKTWYRIQYLDGDKLTEGYIREDGFYLLTVAGLIAVTSDASVSATIKTLISTTTPDELILPSSLAAAPTAAPKNKATATPASGRKRYVLNTKTMKFHLPSCNDAEKIAAENKKTTTTTREALIEQGYTPCQRCKP